MTRNRGLDSHGGHHAHTARPHAFLAPRIRDRIKGNRKNMADGSMMADHFNRAE
ncbi:hypothetical protein [Komagataeibacter diospyri]|uniref:hypothetical protein n=1 Tax=Komagataeibacter diospyri TaxID=1932662 RepID=UPI0012B62FA8|nr:hypothetical protein [Komagataeibacter diospyri]